MAIFEMQAPGGPVIEIDAPDAAQAKAAFEKIRSSQPSVGGDIAKSAGVGLAKGGLGLAGMGGDIGSLITSLAGMPSDARKVFRGIPGVGSSLAGPTSAELQGEVEKYTGEFRKPQTQYGRYAQNIAEFVPGALVPGGGARTLANMARQVPSNLIKFGVLPGAASEAAGQYAEGSWAEPYIRGAAAVGTGGVAALATRPKTAATTIRGALDNVTPQQLDAAENLFMEAQRAGQPITRAEAVQYVTNGATRMGDVQRVVEGQGGMKEFFAPRAAQNEAALGGVARSLDPNPTPATMGDQVGPTAGRVAEQTVDDVRGAINTASDPFYQAASTVRLTPQEMTRVRALPGYAEARDAVRNDPQLARYVQGLPEDSVGFLNEVKKFLDTAAENAAGPMNAQRNQQRAAGYGSDARVARQTGINASPDYEVALGIQERARDQYLQPLLNGPIGRMAGRDTTTQKAIAALFPDNPSPNSANEVTTAVTALSARNPAAARSLVRAHAESVFNESTQNLIGGPNQFGGAKFAAAIRGNPQQAANLEAAVRALPNGDQVWTGFDRFLQIVEAQGTRQRIGSQTAFNQEVLQDLRRGTTVQEAGSAVVTGGLKLPAKIKDTLDRWRLGRGVDEIAALLTNPEAGRRFRQLAEMPSGGNDAAGIFTRLVYLTGEGARSTPDKKVSSRPDQPRSP